MRTVFISLFVTLVPLFQGCGTPVVYTSGPVVRTGQYEPYRQSYGYGNYGKDIRVQTKEDEHGLVSFRVSESGLTEPQVDWLLKQIDDHKSLCQNGGETKKFERTSNVRANPYSTSRSGRGDTTLRVEYVCNRNGSADKPIPRVAPLPVPRLKSGTGA